MISLYWGGRYIRGSITAETTSISASDTSYFDEIFVEKKSARWIPEHARSHCSRTWKLLYAPYNANTKRVHHASTCSPCKRKPTHEQFSSLGDTSTAVPSPFDSWTNMGTWMESWNYQGATNPRKCHRRTTQPYRLRNRFSTIGIRGKILHLVYFGGLQN